MRRTGRADSTREQRSTGTGTGFETFLYGLYCLTKCLTHWTCLLNLYISRISTRRVMPARCLRLTIPVYVKCGDVYELSHCVSHEVKVADNSQASVVIETAKQSTMHAPAIVCCAGHSARICGVIHDVLKYERFDPDAIGPRCSSSTIPENELDVIADNESCIIVTSEYGNVLCPVFDHHTAYRRVVPGYHIQDYMRNVAQLQHKTMARLIRNIVVVKLDAATCDPETVRPNKRRRVV